MNDMSRTFAIIKPDAVESGNAGKIVAHVQQAGFRILGMKLTQISLPQAQKFYERAFQRLARLAGQTGVHGDERLHVHQVVELLGVADEIVLDCGEVGARVGRGRRRVLVFAAAEHDQRCAEHAAYAASHSGAGAAERARG